MACTRAPLTWPLQSRHRALPFVRDVRPAAALFAPRGVAHARRTVVRYYLHLNAPRGIYISECVAMHLPLCTRAHCGTSRCRLVKRPCPRGFLIKFAYCIAIVLRPAMVVNDPINHPKLDAHRGCDHFTENIARSHARSHAFSNTCLHYM